MDWSKAKTILIIAFIITNTLLGYMLIREKPIGESTVKDSFIQDVVELLKDKNISVATQIPKELPHLNTVTVSYEKADLKELNKNLLDNNGIISTNKEGFGEIIKGNESIVLANNKLIIYENKREKEVYSYIDEEKAIRIGEEFIKKGNFDTSDMKLTFVKEEEGVFFLEYSKLYNNIFVERAFTNFQIDKRGVKRFERQWLITTDLGDAEIYINTAPKSMLALLGMENVYGKTITDISLCYYFDPQKHEYLQDPVEAKQGKAVPAWRIKFEDGYKLFIDEY